MATTSKEGSRRANYPIPTRGGSDKKYHCSVSIEAYDWNEYNLNPLTSNNWRTSLVPAPAVIPAPIAYIKVVAVKKLVVGYRIVQREGNVVFSLSLSLSLSARALMRERELWHPSPN
jgi:hypothetical protein